MILIYGKPLCASEHARLPFPSLYLRIYQSMAQMWFYEGCKSINSSWYYVSVLLLLLIELTSVPRLIDLFKYLFYVLNY